MPRQSRKQKKGKSRSSRRNIVKRGGSQESNKFQNVLGITSMVGYNKEALLPGLQVSKRTASNYLTQMAYQQALKRNLFKLWMMKPSLIESMLKQYPALKKKTIEDANKIARGFRVELANLEIKIDEREYELQYGRNAPRIVQADIDHLENQKGLFEERFDYFKDFLEAESPGILNSLNLNNYNESNYYQNTYNNYNNANNTNNNNYGNTLRQLFENENE